MTQKQFENQFNQQGFEAFLLNMTTEELAKIDVNTSNCFLGVYAKRVFKGELYITWSYIDINDTRFVYPAWVTNYLKYLLRLMNHDSEEYKEIVREKSYLFLQK